MAKATKLQPILVERTCEYCKDGLLKFKGYHNDGDYLFRKTKCLCEYVCEKCGQTIKSDKELELRTIMWVNTETKEYYKMFPGRESIIKI